MIKNNKTKKYVKFVSFALMVTCLLSATILPSFAAQAVEGEPYNPVPYTLGGMQGYMESNFTFNQNQNCIMRGETKNVDRSQYTGSLDMYLYYANTGTGNAYREVHKTHDGVGSNIITGLITYDDVSELNSSKVIYGDINHQVSSLKSSVRGVWGDLTVGWDIIYERDNPNT